MKLTEQIRKLTAPQRNAFIACFLGWSLDAFDVQMYSFVIPTVIAVWGLSKGEAGLIGTVTLLISSLGGWFAGTLADRFGRVKMLQITILAADAYNLRPVIRQEGPAGHYQAACQIVNKWWTSLAKC